MGLQLRPCLRGSSEYSQHRKAGAYGVMILLELDKEQLAVLRRALEARARDMQMRLGSDPGDEGFRREAALATQRPRQIETLERQAGRRASSIGDVGSLPEEYKS